MFFKVLKSFEANRKVLERGEIVEFEPSRRTQALVDHRFMLPLSEQDLPKSKKKKEASDGIQL